MTPVLIVKLANECPQKLLHRLFGKVAQDLEKKATLEYLWCGRHVKLVDGSTVTMPDTPENQKAYPQPSTQAAGCGFPIAKIGVLFSLATGASVALVIDVLNTHDVKLARGLYKFLYPGDVLLGDRAFCSYADLVFIQNPLRRCGFSRFIKAVKKSFDVASVLVRATRLLLGTSPRLGPKA